MSKIPPAGGNGRAGALSWIQFESQAGFFLPPQGLLSRVGLERNRDEWPRSPGD